MADLDLRPLSLGEILDRTFSLYRKNFLLFAGITAIPQLLVLALRLAQTVFLFPAGRRSVPADQLQTVPSGSLIAFGLIGALVGIVVYLVAYLFAQGGTVFAVSELYLGRTTTIGASLGRMRGQLGSLFGVILLNGLAVGGAFILLVIPGIYVACRLLTCVPAALLEDLGPRSSLERSWALTKDYAGRGFVINLLYFVLAYAAAFLFTLPFAVAIALSAKNPEALRMWSALSHVGEFVGEVLVSPILTIATAVFYYDLRVRKEAFDLQFMMNPTGPIAPGTPGVAKTFS
ncbi:MAG TPA: hypothetical protein VE778_05325 [Candidatus Bathyarchaeia archaeon]|jgi:hypothetical protein|nr:hypothetical protein [Candidatus Bathyarchaeia archaeon]